MVGMILMKVVLSLVFSVLLIVYVPYSKYFQNTNSYESLVEGLLLATFITFNAWLVYRESKLTQREMSSRIQYYIDLVKKHGISEKDDIRIPTTVPTIAVTRVVRGIMEV